MCNISIIDEFEALVLFNCVSNLVILIESLFCVEIMNVEKSPVFMVSIRKYNKSMIHRNHGCGVPMFLITQALQLYPELIIIDVQLVDNRVFCIHGGLSPDIATIEQIRTLNRSQEIPPTGCFSDLLWSDPDNVDGFQQSPRGAGYLFGEEPVNVVCILC